MRMVVVIPYPDPFGPRRPNTCPSRPASRADAPRRVIAERPEEPARCGSRRPRPPAANGRARRGL
jgi:hypothetical protein